MTYHAKRVHPCSGRCGRLVSVKRKRCPSCGVTFEQRRRTGYHTRKRYWDRQARERGAA